MARKTTRNDHEAVGRPPERYNHLSEELKERYRLQNEYMPNGLKRRLDGKAWTSPWPFKDPSEIVIDNSNWRESVRLNKVKLDDAQKEVFLYWYARTGRLAHSGWVAGVCAQAIRNHCKIDPEFQERFEQAKAEYAERVEEIAQMVALEGVLEPIIGGKNRDQVVAHKRVLATNILAMKLKRTNPEYREKQEIDLNHKGGVMVAPSTLSMDEWIAQFGSAEAKTDTPPEGTDE